MKFVKIYQDNLKNCNEKGTARQLTIPCTPQQSGVAKRRNRTLLDMKANLPMSFRKNVSLTAPYILNKVTFKKCIFIRYLEHSKGYVFISELEDGSITEIGS